MADLEEVCRTHGRTLLVSAGGGGEEQRLVLAFVSRGEHFPKQNFGEAMIQTHERKTENVYYDVKTLRPIDKSDFCLGRLTFSSSL